MQGCIFCGCAAGVDLWAFEAVDHPVPACAACAAEHGLRVTCSDHDAGGLPEQHRCRCCGRELARPGGWPMTVWVADRGRLMAVCNTCRMEFALPAVLTPTPPAGWPARRDLGVPRDRPETKPPR